MPSITRISLAVSFSLLFCLSCAVLAKAQHNACAKDTTISYCQNVGKAAYCKEFTDSRYGRIVG